MSDPKPHQLRVFNERADLFEKMQKLKAFFDSAIFLELDFEEQSRLRRQQQAMALYCDILSERIAAFK